MAESFASGFHVVQVTTDELVRGVPATELWVAAAKREQAVALVLAEVPVGWSAAPLDIQLSQEEIAGLKMQPGDVRKLTR